MDNKHPNIIYIGNGNTEEENVNLETSESEESLTHQQKFLRIFQQAQAGEGDVTFIVGKDKKRIGAHKLILATSPTFQTMFRLASSNEVEILDNIEPKYFELLLKFMYTGECSIQEDDAVPMLNLAKQYRIKDLSTLCGKLLKRALTENSAITVFKQAVEFNEKALEESSLQFICENAETILDTPEFLQLGTEHLCKILARDDLAVFSEFKLFESVMGWAKEVSSDVVREKWLNTPKYIRPVLEKIISHIRFPQMKPSEFALVRFNYDILTTEELLTVGYYRDIPQSKWASLPKSVFNPNRRKYSEVPQFSCILKRLVHPVGFMETSDQWHRICFRADADTYLASIGLNDTDSRFGHQGDTESQYTVTVQVKLDDDTTENQPLATKSKMIEEEDNKQIFHVKFDHPVEIMADTWYTASLQVEGEYYGTRYTGRGSNFVEGLAANGSRVKFEFRDAKKVDNEDEESKNSEDEESKDSEDEENDDNCTNCIGGQMAELGFLSYY